MSKSKNLTPNQTIIVAEIAKGAGTDAEIGEVLSDMKLSAIGSSVRGLVKKGVIAQIEGRYQIDPDYGTDQGDVEDGIEIIEDGVRVVAPEVTETEAPADVEPVEHGDVLGAAYAKKGSPRLLTPSGSGAKMVTVSNTAYVTTDGVFAVVKDRDDKQAPWSLYRLASHAWEGDAETGHATAVAGLVGEFKTCTAAFADPKVLKGAQSA